MNRVLTLDEVLALDDGARVWVDHSNDNYAENWDGIHNFYEHAGLLEGEDGSSWCLLACPGLYNKVFRVWSLPQPPTADELASWPWKREVQHEADRSGEGESRHHQSAPG